MDIIKNTFIIGLILGVFALEYQNGTLNSKLSSKTQELVVEQAKYDKLLENCSSKDYQIKLDKFNRDINKSDFIPTDLSKQKEFNCTEANDILDVLEW